VFKKCFGRPLTVWAAILAVLLACPLVLAQEKTPAGGTPENQEPIKITSNRLEVDDAALTVIFIGQVKAVQGETILYCDRMVVHYLKSDAPAGAEETEATREISQINAYGHVKLLRGDRKAYGREGVYEMAGNRVILTGSPRLTQGPNVITGDKVIVYLDEDRAEVEGGRQGVEAVITPGSSETTEPEAIQE